MGQVTIYIDDELEKRLREEAAAYNVSQSKFVADLLRQKFQDEWPADIVAMFGTWEDFPTLEEIRGEDVPDVPREEL